MFSFAAIQLLLKKDEMFLDPASAEAVDTILLAQQIEYSWMAYGKTPNSGRTRNGMPARALISIRGTRVNKKNRSCARRWPRRFERPDELDLTRTDNPMLTFGLGTHYCLGAPLARLELFSLFSVLFKRLPNLRPNGPAQFGSGFVIRGLTRLPITF